MDPLEDIAKNPLSRALLASLPVAAGTVFATALGGEGGGAVVAQAIASLFGGFLTSSIDKWLDFRGNDPRYTHPNSDLRRLVGKSVAHVIAIAASDSAEGDSRESLVRLSRAAEAAFVTIGGSDRLSAVSEKNLPKLFEAAALGRSLESAPSESDWRAFVEYVSAKAGVSRDNRLTKLVARRLCADMYGAIREMLKRDFEVGGRAYVALTLDMNARMLARLAECQAVSRHSPVEVDVDVRTALQSAFDRQWNSLDLALQQELRWMRSEVAAVSKKLDRLMAISAKTLHAVQRVDRTTGRMLSELTAVRGEWRRFLQNRDSVRLAPNAIQIAEEQRTLGDAHASKVLEVWEQQCRLRRHRVTCVITIVCVVFAGAAACGGYVIYDRAVRLEAAILAVAGTIDGTYGPEAGNDAIVHDAVGASGPENPSPSGTKGIAALEELRLVARNAADDQRIGAMILLGDYSDADGLIRKYRLDSDLAASSSLDWLVWDARNKFASGEREAAAALYRQALERAPDDFALRLEFADSLLVPHYGVMDGRGFSILFSDSSSSAVERLREIEANLRQLIESEPPAQFPPEMPAFLQFRLGLCLKEPLRMNAGEVPRWQEAAEAFRTAGQRFFDDGHRMMAAESLRQEAATILLASDEFENSEDQMKDVSASKEREARLGLAVKRLYEAYGMVGDDDGHVGKEVKYAIGTHLVHALIRNPGSAPLRRLEDAEELLKELVAMCDGHVRHNAALLQAWLYQEKAKHEDVMVNLERAAQCFKQVPNYAIDADGRLIGASLTGERVALADYRIRLATADGSEPAIRFTFYGDWLAAGRTYKDYMDLPVGLGRDWPSD